MQDLDHSLFLVLNFDGGPLCDRLMLTLSGVAIWIPLYALILWLVWRREGWRGTLLFLLLAAAALGVADMVAGIFKHSGLLGDLFPGITPRWRPMFTPALEGLDITPDSLRTLRRMAPEALAAAGYASDWAVHVPVEAVSGRFGTVSAHAATIVAMSLLAIRTICRRWFTLLMVLCAAAICYSRIYLAKHFPADILWGAALGALLGWGADALRRCLTRRSSGSE